MQNRLSEDVKDALCVIINESPFLDGFSIGGGVAAGYGGPDVDTDLLMPSREIKEATVRQHKSPYYFFKSIRDRFAELTDGKELDIRVGIMTREMVPIGYRPTAIYVLRDSNLLETWQVDPSISETYYCNSS